jgi:hypothetical protein
VSKEFGKTKEEKTQLDRVKLKHKFGYEKPRKSTKTKKKKEKANQ